MKMFDFSSFDTTTWNQILAWVLTAILLNSLYKLSKGVKARLTSWGLFMIAASGTLFIRFPEAYGVTWVADYQLLIRGITYVIVIILDILDWVDFFKIKKEKGKERERRGE
jgi:hypothetical protein